MGFYITHLKQRQLGKYIGSQTIYSCADNGAFDGKVSKDLEEYCNQNENVIAIVDRQGIEYFIDTLKNSSVVGRDIQELISEVENNYKEGFMIVQ